MLGEAFQKVFGAAGYALKCTDIDVNAPWLTHLDFRDRDAYAADVEAFARDYLFHLGAHTSLEYCEEYPDDAYATNTLAVENARSSRTASTFRFSTSAPRASLTAARKPMTTGTSQTHSAIMPARYMGERFVVEYARRHLVCRAGWMMGAGPAKDKKFIQKLMVQLKSGATELKVVNDKLGTPTYPHDFARNVQLLVEKEHWGLYNMVCGGVTSRLEVARYLVETLGLAAKVKVVPVSSAYFAEDYFAPRPPSERLITKKLDLRGLNMMRDWRVCLDEYLSDYYQGYLN